uniref:IF rod domain-containing protein n=1 Tax=Pygocentrus nattereri TaxID=42514 RepID=A0AAR2LRH3_PYGNA
MRTCSHRDEYQLSLAGIELQVVSCHPCRDVRQTCQDATGNLCVRGRERKQLPSAKKTTQRAGLTRQPLSSAELIAACRRKLQTLLIWLHNLISVNRSLKRTLAEARSQENSVASRYEAQIAGLEAAIEAAKCDLHEQIISHKELLDMKLALGAEIATYWSLLDGEELGFPTQASRGSSTLYLSESPPPSTRSSSPVNPAEADVTAETRSEVRYSW